MKILFLTAVIATCTLPPGVYDGYCDHWGNEVPGLITNDTWMTGMPPYVSGKMVFYGPYAMDATAEYRGIDYEREGCIGGVSLMSPYDIGKKAWVRVEGEWYGPFCVVDCARRGDMYSIVVYRDEVVEVEHEFAVQVGMVTPDNSARGYSVNDWYLDVEVLVDRHPIAHQVMCPDCEPVDYSDYFLSEIEFAEGYEPGVLPVMPGVWKEYGTDVYWRRDLLSPLRIDPLVPFCGGMR